MKQLLGRSVNKHYREVQQLGEELCEMIELLKQTEADLKYESPLSDIAEEIHKHRIYVEKKQEEESDSQS